MAIPVWTLLCPMNFLMSMYVASALGWRKWHLQTGRFHMLFVCNNIKVAIPFVFASQPPHDLFTTDSRIRTWKTFSFPSSMIVFLEV